MSVPIGKLIPEANVKSALKAIDAVTSKNEPVELEELSTTDAAAE